MYWFPMSITLIFDCKIVLGDLNLGGWRRCAAACIDGICKIKERGHRWVEGRWRLTWLMEMETVDLLCFVRLTVES